MGIGCEGCGCMGIGVRVWSLGMVKYTGSRRIGETGGRGRSYTVHDTQQSDTFQTNASKE